MPQRNYSREPRMRAPNFPTSMSEGAGGDVGGFFKRLLELPPELLASILGMDPNTPSMFGVPSGPPPGEEPTMRASRLGDERQMGVPGQTQWEQAAVPPPGPDFAGAMAQMAEGNVPPAPPQPQQAVPSPFMAPPPGGGAPMPPQAGPDPMAMAQQIQGGMQAQHQQGMSGGGIDQMALAQRIQAAMQAQHRQNMQGGQPAGGQSPAAPSPFQGPQQPVQAAMAGPVPEPQGINHVAAANMLAAFPPQSQGESSPFQPERPIESYFSDASLQERLGQARRTARGQALLAMGAAMLGGEDLMGGLSAAGRAAQGPLSEYQAKKEELPLEYAKNRFDIERTRAEEGRLAAGETRKDAAERRAEAGEGREAGLYPSQQRQAEQTVEENDVNLGTLGKLNDLRIQAMETGNKQNEAAIRQIDAGVAALRQNIQQSKEEFPMKQAQSGMDLLKTKAETQYLNERPRQSTAGKLTPAAAASARKEAYAWAEGSVEDDKDIDGAALFRLAQTVANVSDDQLSMVDKDLGIARVVMEYYSKDPASIGDLKSMPEVAGNPKLEALVRYLASLQTDGP